MLNFDQIFFHTFPLRALSLATRSTLKSGLPEMASVAFEHKTQVIILTGSSYPFYLVISCYVSFPY